MTSTSGAGPKRSGQVGREAADAGAAQGRPAGDGGGSSGHSGSQAVADAAQAVGQLAGEAAQLGKAWFDLARAEAAVARSSAVRLLGATAAAVVLGLCLWIFTCAALAMWLAGWLGRADAALALVAGLHLLLVGALVVAMRRWLRALQMRRSREALAQLGKAFSP